MGLEGDGLATDSESTCRGMAEGRGVLGAGRFFRGAVRGFAFRFVFVGRGRDDGVSGADSATVVETRGVEGPGSLSRKEGSGADSVTCFSSDGFAVRAGTGGS